jgi:hypothetical protein
LISLHYERQTVPPLHEVTRPSLQMPPIDGSVVEQQLIRSQVYRQRLVFRYSYTIEMSTVCGSGFLRIIFAIFFVY